MSYNPYFSMASTFPGTLDTASNASMARLSPVAAGVITRLEADVEAAPVGSAIIVDFKIGTRSTGAVGASIGTVTIAAGAFTGATDISAASLSTGQFLVAEVTQVGSTTPGSNLTATARGRAA